MIRNCQQFEERIQNLLDSHIDPETDQAICAHANICGECSESLMAYSIMYSNYLNDSDSMKIKLENLVLHETFARKIEEKPNHRHRLAVVASIAAMILVVVTLSSRMFDQPQIEPHANLDEHQVVEVASVSGLEQLVEIRKQLGENDLYFSISELPGLRPIKTLAMYIDWFQQSWFGQTNKIGDDPDDLGLRYQFDTNRQYSAFSKLACCS